MLLDELVRLDEWLVEYEDRYGAVNLLSQLQTILNENIQATNPNHRGKAIQAFTEEKKNVIYAIGKFNLSELSAEQIQCLKVHNADKYMGKDAANHIFEVFRDEAHDLAYLTSEIQKTLQTINTAKSNISNVAKSISPYSNAVNKVDYLADRARFSIIFREGVSVESLKDLEQRSKEWSNIMHGLGVAFNIAPTEFKVLGARNGSFVIDLYMCAAAIVPIGFILNRSLAILERFALSIRRMDEIFGTDIDDPAFKHIEEQIKATSEDYFNTKKIISAKNMADEILDSIDCDENRRAEADTFLQTSIKKILNHLRKGGDLDAFVPNKYVTDQDEESGEVNLNIDAIKQIDEFRHKKIELSDDLVKLLEHFDFEEDVEG